MSNKLVDKLANLTEIDESSLYSLNSKSLFDAVILNTNFSTSKIGKHSIIAESNSYLQNSYPLIDKCCSQLKDGGIIFIYGLPNYLSFFGEYLSDKKKDDYFYLFKYWIACEFQLNETGKGLPNAHIGLLMYLKSKSKHNPTPFEINTKYVRIPYNDCPSCGKTTKDWGGKKHMINPLGSAISDVWSFINIPIIKTNRIPAEIIERILALFSKDKEVLIVNQSKVKVNFTIPIDTNEIAKTSNLSLLVKNKVIHQSCIDYLNHLRIKYPEGVFDLAFADPPYNLEKNYSNYEDDLEEKNYINWCNEWLLAMVNNLKAGGALFVLNIPKWAIYHFNFLSDKMIFQNWIVWDALSTPAGKLLPAHYSLLYFTKQGAEPKVNLNEDRFIDSREYCLRNSCISNRKKLGEDKKELLTDVWKDIHRIKHKKDRDHHPCQLPTKLMKRIIKIFTNKNDIVFDPFGGAGTTAIAAKLLNRDFVITELDKMYVGVAERNLSKIQKNVFGTFYYERESITKSRPNGISRKQIEKSYMDLCIANNKIYSMDELKLLSPDIFQLIIQYQGSFGKLQSAVKRKIETLSLFT